MIDLFFTLLFEVMVAMGVYMITDKGKLLYCPAVWLTDKLQKWIGDKSKYITYPIYDCITCMGSFWGAITFVTLYTGDNWLILPLFMLASAGANAFVYSVYEKSNEI